MDFLGLMALDRTELKIYENTGKENEKGYAKAIIPVYIGLIILTIRVEW